MSRVSRLLYTIIRDWNGSGERQQFDSHRLIIRSREKPEKTWRWQCISYNKVYENVLRTICGVNCLPDAENCSDAASFSTMLRFLILRQLEILNDTTGNARASCYCDTNEIDFGRAERKKDRGVRPAYKHDGHLEFLEVRRVSGDYLRERNQSIIRSPSCFLPPPPPPLSLSLSLSHFPSARGAPFTGYSPDGNFPPVALITAISVRLTIIISWYPIDDGPRRRAAVPPFFSSLKSNDVIRLSLGGLIVSTATMNNRWTRWDNREE